jgi:transposase
MATSSYIGIDVSKNRLDVAVRGDKQTWEIGNTPGGIQELVEQMADLQPELVVVEATGGYQRAVVDGLFHAGVAVAVVNSGQAICQSLWVAGQNG